jgi:hypothetical protein
MVEGDFQDSAMKVFVDYSCSKFQWGRGGELYPPNLSFHAVAFSAQRRSRSTEAKGATKP